jgi:HK97 gp10 family phage protein
MEINAGKVLGQKALIKAMRQIPYTVKKDKFFMAVFRAAAKPIIQAARANINNKEGDLKRSIKAFSTRASRRWPGLYVGPKAKGGSAKKNTQRSGGFYGGMVEYGTAHSAPHPFMRPAYEQKKTQGADILLKGATLVVNKAINKALAGKKRLYT